MSSTKQPLVSEVMVLLSMRRMQPAAMAMARSAARRFVGQKHPLLLVPHVLTFSLSSLSFTRCRCHNQRPSRLPGWTHAALRACGPEGCRAAYSHAQLRRGSVVLLYARDGVRNHCFRNDCLLQRLIGDPLLLQTSGRRPHRRCVSVGGGRAGAGSCQYGAMRRCSR
jgi:hypothetical protein